MPTYTVREQDHPGDRSWRLLDWCVRRGADEFSLAFLGPPYVPGTSWARLDELLAPFRRRTASAGDRWLLTGETVAVLHDVLPDGLFTRTPADSSLEDLTVYRNGEALLRIVTREAEGILRIRDDEAPSLERAQLIVHRQA
jgi:hypothetical protein